MPTVLQKLNLRSVFVDMAGHGIILFGELNDLVLGDYIGAALRLAPTSISSKYQMGLSFADVTATAIGKAKQTVQ